MKGMLRATHLGSAAGSRLAVVVLAWCTPSLSGQHGGAAPVAGEPERQPIELPKGSPDPGENPFSPVTADALRNRLSGSGFPEAELVKWDAALKQRGLATATEELLRRRRPDLAAAVGAASRGEPRAALDLVKVLASSGSDRVLRSYSRYHLGRLLLDSGDARRAAEVFASHLQEDPSITPLDGEMLFFHGRALSAWPARDQAIRVLAGYLKWFPGAPWEYRNVARAELEQLLARASQPLHGLADQMQAVEQLMRAGRTGGEVQRMQREITAELAKLLDQSEQQQQEEQSGSSSIETAPGNPSEESRLPDGESRIGDLSPTPEVAERWGDLRDAEREAIRAQLSEELPPHYRRLLEAYYLRLARRKR